MAIFGDLGKAFGLGTTQEVGGSIGQFFGSKFGPVGAKVGENIGRDIGKDLGEIGSRGTVDVSAPPAGVDSPATTSQVSQTSQVLSTGSMRDPNRAFIGGLGLAGPALATARTVGQRLFGSPAAAFTTGGVAAAVVDFFVDEFGQQKKLVITRKLQRDIKKIFIMTGGDFRTTSDIYRSATGRFIPEDMIIKILFKTFKNQGPYVTKAAVRKTRSTIRKMETLCDLKDRLAPPRRAAPRRRATTATKILQVK